MPRAGGVSEDEGGRRIPELRQSGQPGDPTVGAPIAHWRIADLDPYVGRPAVFAGGGRHGARHYDRPDARWRRHVTMPRGGGGAGREVAPAPPRPCPVRAKTNKGRVRQAWPPRAPRGPPSRRGRPAHQRLGIPPSHFYPVRGSVSPTPRDAPESTGQLARRRARTPRDREGGLRPAESLPQPRSGITPPRRSRRSRQGTTPPQHHRAASVRRREPAVVPGAPSAPEHAGTTHH